MYLPALSLISSSLPAVKKQNFRAQCLANRLPYTTPPQKKKKAAQMRLHCEAEIMGFAWVSHTEIDAFYMPNWSFLSDSDCVTLHQLGDKQKTSARFHTVYIINFIRGKKKQKPGVRKSCITLIETTLRRFFFTLNLVSTGKNQKQ